MDELEEGALVLLLGYLCGVVLLLVLIEGLAPGTLATLFHVLQTH